jgi:hypothetical protein
MLARQARLNTGLSASVEIEIESEAQPLAGKSATLDPAYDGQASLLATR